MQAPLVLACSIIIRIWDKVTPDVTRLPGSMSALEQIYREVHIEERNAVLKTQSCPAERALMSCDGLFAQVQEDTSVVLSWAAGSATAMSSTLGWLIGSH